MMVSISQVYLAVALSLLCVQMTSQHVIGEDSLISVKDNAVAYSEPTVDSLTTTEVVKGNTVPLEKPSHRQKRTFWPFTSLFGYGYDYDYYRPMPGPGFFGPGPGFGMGPMGPMGPPPPMFGFGFGF